MFKSIFATHTGFCDATIYESYIEYPTDAKLLWKSCCDVYQVIKYKRKELKLRHTRINYEKRKIQYLSFAKRRKKGRRQRKKVCKTLLRYLVRLMEQLAELLTKHKAVQSNVNTRFGRGLLLRSGIPTFGF